VAEQAIDQKGAGLAVERYQARAHTSWHAVRCEDGGPLAEVAACTDHDVFEIERRRAPERWRVGHGDILGMALMMGRR